MPNASCHSFHFLYVVIMLHAKIAVWDNRRHERKPASAVMRLKFWPTSDLYFGHRYGKVVL